VATITYYLPVHFPGNWGGRIVVDCRDAVGGRDALLHLRKPLDQVRVQRKNVGRNELLVYGQSRFKNQYLKTKSTKKQSYSFILSKRF
jgi:hypothetical protein